MPVSATIPITADFLQTAATFSFVTELIAHPTNGYIYGCYTPGPASIGGIVKISATNYTDITIATFASDGKHINPIDMTYSSTTDRFYVLFRNADDNQLTITAVHPATLARTDLINLADEIVGPGPGSICVDTTNLYLLTFVDDPNWSYIYKIPLATGLVTGLVELVGFRMGHCLRLFSGKLFAVGIAQPASEWLMRITTAGVIEESATFAAPEGEFPVDDMGDSADHIWVGNRDHSGIIRKYSKTSFASVELIATGQLDRCTCVKRVGDYVWAAFENGRGVRIKPSNTEQRIYTLNTGQGYHSEFTGTNEFVHTYALFGSFAGKISRYHIPSDVVPGQTQWVRQMTATFQLNPLDMAVDHENNTIVVGNLNTGNSTRFANFGGPPLQGSGGYQGFIAKYTPDNVHLWSKLIGCPNSSSATGVAVDSQNNIIVTGYYGCTSDFGGFSTPLLNDGFNNAFVVKFEPNGPAGVTDPGRCLWAIRFSGAGTITGKAVTVNASDEIIAGPRFNSETNFGGGFVLPAVGYDMALVRLSGTTGNTLYARRFGSNSSDLLNVITIDPLGEVVITGVAGGSINFGGGASPSGGTFVAKLSGTDFSFDTTNADLTRRSWARVFSATAGNGVVIEPTTRNVFVTGGFEGSCDFGSGTAISSSDYPHEGGLFLVGYGPSGNWLWNMANGGSGDTNEGISLGFFGGLSYLGITGRHATAINFGMPPILFGGYLVANFTISGNSPPVYQWGKNATAISTAVSFDSIGHILTTGNFRSRADFGNGIILDTSAIDGFLAQYTK